MRCFVSQLCMKVFLFPFQPVHKYLRINMFVIHFPCMVLWPVNILRSRKPSVWRDEIKIIKIRGIDILCEGERELLLKTLTTTFDQTQPVIISQSPTFLLPLAASSHTWTPNLCNTVITRNNNNTAASVSTRTGKHLIFLVWATGLPGKGVSASNACPLIPLASINAMEPFITGNSHFRGLSPCHCNIGRLKLIPYQLANRKSLQEADGFCLVMAVSRILQQDKRVWAKMDLYTL